MSATVKEDVNDTITILAEVDKEFVLLEKGQRFSDELTDVHAQIRRALRLLMGAEAKMITGQNSALEAAESTGDEGLGGILDDLNKEQKHGE